MSVSNSEKDFLFLHGGAFTLLSAHPSAPFVPDTYRTLLIRGTTPLLGRIPPLVNAPAFPKKTPSLLRSSMPSRDTSISWMSWVTIQPTSSSPATLQEETLHWHWHAILSKIEDDVQRPLLPAPPGYLLLISPLGGREQLSLGYSSNV